MFKGGTSLSKCYDAIDRFSEDIDTNINFDERASIGDKRAFKLSVLRAIEEVGFKLLNDEVNPSIETRSGRDFNKYLAGYNKEFINESASVNHIIVETNVSYRAFPCEILSVSNYMTKYLSKESEFGLITEYELDPFEMRVQTIDRTFIDKLFAVCDYYEEKSAIDIHDTFMIYT
ncbi:nucleotidyl transferase AbiEii/AbiGii toxin family protein [Exiguobacterium sp. ERU656]|uniref:nucleotidyl transferase AbiEii/AbiGii toxin family protein n=1 Tax=Exiguobacterium sp. ERU656 TaxID=2751217 RepID=UPI001BEB598C